MHECSQRRNIQLWTDYILYTGDWLITIRIHDWQTMQLENQSTGFPYIRWKSKFFSNIKLYTIAFSWNCPFIIPINSKNMSFIGNSKVLAFYIFCNLFFWDPWKVYRKVCFHSFLFELQLSLLSFTLCERFIYFITWQKDSM